MISPLQTTLCVVISLALARAQGDDVPLLTQLIQDSSVLC